MTHVGLDVTPASVMVLATRYHKFTQVLRFVSISVDTKLLECARKANTSDRVRKA